jgi:hypothetical protein
MRSPRLGLGLQKRAVEKSLLGGLWRRAGNIMRFRSPGSSFLCLVGHDVNISKISQLRASAAAELADATFFKNYIVLS